jgi:hypothetical protein
MQDEVDKAEEREIEKYNRFHNKPEYTHTHTHTHKGKCNNTNIN